jgi:polyphosphate kinase 2 (PPK2 family)
VVRVHPEYLDTQRIDIPDDLEQLWLQRFESIREYEKHLSENGTVIVKFWLNVSKEEQRLRFLSRLDEARKNWKFSIKDVEEREHWEHYMSAYHQTLAATSRPWAPWYAIPADDKPYMRWQVARIIRKTLQEMDPNYPKADKDAAKRFTEMRNKLYNEIE